MIYLSQLCRINIFAKSIINFMDCEPNMLEVLWETKEKEEAQDHLELLTLMMFHLINVPKF
jgi:hypothetical protein